MIEHVNDDLAALRELRRVLRPGGYVLLTVPEFHLLWGLQDDVVHHKRRYRLHRLLKMLPVADLSPRRYFYFNYLLFLPILAARRLMRRLKIRVASAVTQTDGTGQRSSLARMASADFVQTKGLWLALCSAR